MLVVWIIAVSLHFTIGLLAVVPTEFANSEIYHNSVFKIPKGEASNVSQVVVPAGQLEKRFDQAAEESPEVSIQQMEPFPNWLKDLTGLEEWPGITPPFINTGTIDFSIVPFVHKRGLGDCGKVTMADCSFDCYHCMAPDDIASCPQMSQTFDDGPSPATPKLLSELTDKTTFFTQGINVVRFPATVKQQHQEGHLLASHTWSHPNLAAESNESIAAQLQWSIWALNATAGIIPRYFRPPYGAADNRIRSIARQLGLICVFWDRDTFDWKVNDETKRPNEILQEVQIWNSESQSALILEHDSTIRTVNVGLEVSKLFNHKQMTVAECVNGPWYQ